MKKGSQYELQVESLANSGDGVGRINDKVVFIPFACPGDTLKVEITLDKKSFSKARILEIMKASESRRIPHCQHFGECGGCDWQHVQYQEQLHWKKKSLQEVITKIAQLDTSGLLGDIQANSQEFHYRNRIQLHSDKKGLHYFKKGSQTPCYIQSCPLASESINQWITSHKLPKGKWELAENTSGKVDVFSVNDVGQSDLGFRQVNNEQNDAIAEKVLELISQERITSVADLYCGQGNWSLKIARQKANVQCIGIDINPKNIDEANKNKLSNTQYFLGDVFKLYNKWADQSQLTIVDPPRSGCSPETIDLLNSLPCEWLVYISCHPATLARDLKSLCAQKWRLEQVIPFDMFPQTPHLECLTILRSANALKTANP